MCVRILIAPQEFKGTLSAVQAADVLAKVIREELPGAELDIAPIADGGPGMLDAVLGAIGGSKRSSTVEGPLGKPVAAVWGITADGAALIEMAAASGFVLLQPGERDPGRTSTFGTGQLIRAALDAECQRVLVGLGGSATNDGGAGAAAALGVRFLDADGRELPRGGSALSRLARIDLTARDPRLESAELLIAVDVSNPLCGPTGASRIYGPQKGADAAAIEELDAALRQLADVVFAHTGERIDLEPGAGAAGGLAFGLATLCNGRIRPGFDLVASFLHLDRRIERAELILTGEGRLDEQTAFGKGPGALAWRARRAAKRTVIFAGTVDPSFRPESSPFDEVIAITAATADSAMAQQAMALLEEAARTWARKFVAG